MAENPLQAQKDTGFFHLPPQSLEAEESLLSAILIDNKTVLDCAEILTPENFYKTAHQKIFSAVLGLFSKNEPICLNLRSSIIFLRISCFRTTNFSK